MARMKLISLAVVSQLEWPVMVRASFLDKPISKCYLGLALATVSVKPCFLLPLISKTLNEIATEMKRLSILF